MNRYDKEDAEAIFSKAFDRDDASLVAMDNDGARVPKELMRDSTARPFHWSPACEVDGLNPLVVPSLPFPFTAPELAAFMVDGVGAHLAAHYGPWQGGPDEQLANEINPMGVRAKQALREAYAAYRQAELAVGPRPDDLEQKARSLALELRTKNQEANARLKLYEPGITDAERESRRERARGSIAGLKLAQTAAAKEADVAYFKWRKAIVLHLLRPSPQASAAPARRGVVIDRAWIEATRLVGRGFTQSEIEGGWPEALEPHRLASLQFPQDGVGQSYLKNAAIAACKSGELRCTVIEREDHGLIPGKPDQIDVWTDYLIRAHDFAGWWFAKGESPSVHIAAWLAACGVTLRSQPPGESTAAQVGRQHLTVGSRPSNGGSLVTAIAEQGAAARAVQREQAADHGVPDAPATPSHAVGIGDASSTWSLRKPKRFQAYGWPLYQLLEAAHAAGRAIPTPRDVLEAFASNTPGEIAKVMHDELHYYLASGDTKSADLRAIKATIDRMTTG